MQIHRKRLPRTQLRLPLRIDGRRNVQSGCLGAGGGRRGAIPVHDQTHNLLISYQTPVNRVKGEGISVTAELLVLGCGPGFLPDGEQAGGSV